MTSEQTAPDALVAALLRLQGRACRSQLWSDCNCDGFSFGHEPDCDRQHAGYVYRLCYSDLEELGMMLPDIIAALRADQTAPDALVGLMAELREHASESEKYGEESTAAEDAMSRAADALQHLTALRPQRNEVIEKLRAHYEDMCIVWGEDSGEAGSAFVALEIAEKGEYRSTDDGTA